MSALPEKVEDIRTHVTVGAKGASHTRGYFAHDAFEALKYDNSYDFDKFKNEMDIKITAVEHDRLEFDLIGVDAPVANAFRRILLSEVPTMAIDKVVLYQNTSIIQDEVLAHRLGLIPLKADPRQFTTITDKETQPATEANTLVFTLDIKCTRNENAPAAAPAAKKFNNATVLSSDIKWVAQGKQAEKFGAGGVGVVHEDIVVAKLRPGQSIEAELHAVKGIGQTHAKFSPVCTASYKLLPEVRITGTLSESESEALVKKCPMGVFDIEDLAGKKTAVVQNSRACTMCRECIREPEWSEKVELKRVRNHFIFSVETTGAYTPRAVFKEALRVFIDKCKHVLNLLTNKDDGSDGSDGSDASQANGNDNNDNDDDTVKMETDE